MSVGSFSGIWLFVRRENRDFKRVVTRIRSCGLETVTSHERNRLRA